MVKPFYITGWYFWKKARKLLGLRFLFNFPLFYLAYFFDKYIFYISTIFLTNSAFKASCQVDKKKLFLESRFVAYYILRKPIKTEKKVFWFWFYLSFNQICCRKLKMRFCKLYILIQLNYQICAHVAYKRLDTSRGDC